MNWKPLLIVGLLVLMPMASARNLDAPAPPLDLEVSSSEGTAHLEWDAPVSEGGSPLEGYNIYRIENQTHALLATVDAGTNEYDDDTLLPNTTYVYYVTAFNDDGESPPSNPSPLWYPWCPVIIIDDDPLSVGVHQSCLFPLPIPVRID